LIISFQNITESYICYNNINVSTTLKEYLKIEVCDEILEELGVLDG